MGHQTSGILIRSEHQHEALRQFDLRPVKLHLEVTLFPFTDFYVDHWMNKLGVYGFASERPLCNAWVIHEMMKQTILDSRFAVFDTDYFGSQGDQSAAVYTADKEVIPPRSPPKDQSIGL